jgi:hypothetical protein
MQSDELCRVIDNPQGLLLYAQRVIMFLPAVQLFLPVVEEYLL